MGPANIILSTKEAAMMLQYLETIRWKLVPQKDKFANHFFSWRILGMSFVK